MRLALRPEQAYRLGAPRASFWRLARPAAPSRSRPALVVTRASRPGVGWLPMSDSGSAADRADVRRRRCFAERRSMAVAGTPLLPSGVGGNQRTRRRTIPIRAYRSSEWRCSNNCLPSRALARWSRRERLLAAIAVMVAAPPDRDNSTGGSLHGDVLRLSPPVPECRKQGSSRGRAEMPLIVICCAVAWRVVAP
jgi:hypothetical protein